MNARYCPRFFVNPGASDGSSFGADSMLHPEGVLAEAVVDVHLQNPHLATDRDPDRFLPGGIQILAQFLGVLARAGEVRNAYRNVALARKDPLTAILVFHFNGLGTPGERMLAQIFEQGFWFAHDSEWPPVFTSFAFPT